MKPNKHYSLAISKAIAKGLDSWDREELLELEAAIMHSNDLTDEDKAITLKDISLAMDEVDAQLPHEVYAERLKVLNQRYRREIGHA